MLFLQAINQWRIMLCAVWGHEKFDMMWEWWYDVLYQMLTKCSPWHRTKHFNYCKAVEQSVEIKKVLPTEVFVLNSFHQIGPVMSGDILLIKTTCWEM